MESNPDSTSTLGALQSRWARALQGDSDALRELAESYWYCVYVWWRRSGLEAEQAAAATVASFTRWAGRGSPAITDSGAGLMSHWLPARLTELAAEEWGEDGEPVIAVEGEWAEVHYPDEPEGEPNAIFHRRWTLTVLEFAIQALRAEYAARGLEALFSEASDFIGFASADEAQYATAAERLGMTTGAMKRAVFDFRTQHRELLRSIVADTVADPANVDGEITTLLCGYDLPTGSQARQAPLPTAIRQFKPEELLARAMRTVEMTSGGQAQWKPPSDAEVARLFPQYETLGIIGRGGMGAVYRARQVALDREVAIKLLPLEVSVDPNFADRFVREARAMAKLSHPNIITVFDFGTTSEGHLFFIMEYVEGANLSEIIRGPGLAPEQALVIAGQVCTALAYAHGKGVIHRDIKPANVMVGTEGVAKVADFGLARLTGTNVEEFGHTVTGTVLGTPEYMAPEQKRGMIVDHRADIFSMGVMLYEMICKEPPQGTFEPPSERAGCDAGIDQIVLKAMDRRPENRYQSTVEMKADLDAAWQRQVTGTPLPASSHHHHLPPPRAHAGGSHPHHLPPPTKAHGRLVAVLLVAALVVAGAIYSTNQTKKRAGKLASQASRVPPAQAPVPAATPVPEALGPPIPPGFKPPEAMPAKGNRPEPRPSLAGPKDLLADVDIARDARLGEWQMAPEGLRVGPEGEGDAKLLCFELTPPEEYDFEIEFTIQGGFREVTQVMPLAEHSVVWKMGYSPWDPAYFAFGDSLDNKKPSATGRTEAVVRLPRLKPNQRYRSTVEVRRDSLRALIDGEEVLRWSGDLKRLTLDDGFLNPDAGKLGVAVWGSTILFHKAVIHPPGTAESLERAKAKPTATSNVAAVPAASELVAASNDPRLVQLEAIFKMRFDNEAQKPYLTSIAALNQSYLANWLARIRPAAQAKGSLDEVTAVDAEIAAIGKGEGVPPVDESGTPDSLKNARAAYRGAMNKYTATRTKAAVQLCDLYLTSLDGYVADLTRANKIEQARKVRALRDETAGKKAEILRPPGTEPLKTETTPAAPSPDFKAAAPASGSMRDAVRWFLSKGGKCTISKGNLEGEALTERDLPAGKFEVIGLMLDRNESTLPPLTDADLQALREIKTLHRVWLLSHGLGDAAFAFLADNPDLTSVALHSENLTDGVLTHLTNARKLSELTVVYAKSFTGRNLEKMRWMPGLAKADLSSCGISDEGLKALLAAPRLRSLKLFGESVNATDAGLIALAAHPALSDLGFDECKSFTDSGLAILAKLKTLTVLSAADTNFGDTAATAFAGHREIRQLKLRGTPLTDAGLAKLASLTKLQTIDVTRTSVTPAGIEAFKKAVPKCQVVH